jgi:choline-glycine betaine transporter
MFDGIFCATPISSILFWGLSEFSSDYIKKKKIEEMGVAQNMPSNMDMMTDMMKNFNQLRNAQ